MFKHLLFRNLTRELYSDQGGAPTPTATAPPQPGAPGQEQRQEPGARTTPQGARGEAFWGNFPNIPQERRAELEPHLREVQRYVTQVEQRAAPFRDYTPQQVQGLANFARAFDQDPISMWLRMAGDLQQRGLIHEDLDLEAVAKVVQGLDPDEGTAPVGQGLEPSAEEIPQWAQELKARMDAADQRTQEQERANLERTQDIALQQMLKTMSGQLKAAGIELSETKMMSSLIAHNGNVDAAVKDEISHKDSLLKGLVPKDDNEDLDLSDGVPQRTTPKRRAPRDAFEGARNGAEQFLRKAAREAQS